MMPSKKAMDKVKDAIRIITCRKSAYEGLEQKVEKLNPLIRGWRNYFQHGNSVKRFKQLDEYVWMKLWRRVYYRRKQRKYREHVLYGFRKWYAASGIEIYNSLAANGKSQSCENCACRLDSIDKYKQQVHHRSRINIDARNLYRSFKNYLFSSFFLLAMPIQKI